MKLKLKLVGALCAIGVMQSASALTVVGNSITNLATEYLGGATITLNNIGFNASTQGVVAGNALSVQIKLSAGTFSSCGVFTQIDSVNSVINSTPAWSAAGAGSDTCTYSQTSAGVTVNTTASNTFFRLASATASGFGNLVTSGTNDNGCGFTTGVVTLNAKYFDASNTNVDIETRAATDARLLAANPNAKLDTAVIITAGQAITGAWTAAGDTVVDVRNTNPAGTRFVVPASSTSQNSVTIPLGNVTFKNETGVQADGTGTTDYTLTAALNATVTVGVTAAGGNIPAGTNFYMVDTATGNCLTAPTQATGTVSISGANATLRYAPSNANLVNLTQNTGTFALCMTIPGNLTAAVPQLAFSTYIKVDRSAAIVSDYAGGPTCLSTLNKLTYNAGLIEIRNYVPAAQSGSGWQTFIRVINAGATATPITGYFVSDTGTVGPTGTIIASVAARGNATISNTAIEAALGAIPAGSGNSNPRLVIIGNTDVLRAQNYIRQPGGFWIEASSGQDDGTNAAGSNR